MAGRRDVLTMKPNHHCPACGKPMHVSDLDSPEIKGMLAVERDDAHRETIRKTALEFLARLRAGVLCDACGDKAAGQRLIEDRRRVLAVQMASLDWVVPPDFQATKLDHPHMQTAAVKAALAWTWGPKGLFLVGPTGQCKSRCAYELLRREHLAGRACAQYSVVQWSIECNKTARTGDGWYETVKDCDLLLIDDFGKTRLTSNDSEATRATEMLFDAFDQRAKYHRPTFITTQLTSSEVTDRWGKHGDAFLRRVAQYSTVVRFGPVRKGE